MVSSKWSEKEKMNTGKKFSSRIKNLFENADFRAESRRNKVAIDLSIALVESGMTRQAVADQANIKLSQLSRQLSGDVNLTLDSIGKICEAMRYEFDLVLRKAEEKPALQHWQHKMNRTTLVRLVTEPSSRTYKSAPQAWRTSPVNSNLYDDFCKNEESFSPQLNVA